MIALWIIPILIIVAYAIGYFNGRSELRAQKKRERDSELMARRYNWPESTPPKKLRGPGECECCGVDADTWCDDDCDCLDPWDYR